MHPIIAVSRLSKTYASGFQAMSDINLAINCGEIFALLGPNGAGKTTLISIICGLVGPAPGACWPLDTTLSPNTVRHDPKSGWCRRN